MQGLLSDTRAGRRSACKKFTAIITAKVASKTAGHVSALNHSTQNTSRAHHPGKGGWHTLQRFVFVAARSFGFVLGREAFELASKPYPLSWTRP